MLKLSRAKYIRQILRLEQNCSAFETTDARLSFNIFPAKCESRPTVTDNVCGMRMVGARGYVTKFGASLRSFQLPSIDHETNLPLADGSNFTIRRLNVEDEGLLKAVYSLVQDCVERGDNVGTDEYPKIEYLKCLVKFSDTFLFYYQITNPIDQANSSELMNESKNQFTALHEKYDKPSGVVETKNESNSLGSPLQFVGDKSLRAVIVIEPKIDGVSRSLIPCNAHHIYFTQRDITEEQRRFLVQFTVQATTLLNKGYTACTAYVFFLCLNWLDALKAEGFSVVSCVHKAGRLATGKGYITSYILYKNNHLKPQAKPDIDTIRRRADVIADSVSSLTSPEGSSARVVPYLPVDHVLKDGTRIVIRSLREEEYERVYELFCREGYGWDEFPTLNFFRKMVLDHGYGLVFEQKMSSSISSDNSTTDSSSCNGTICFRHNDSAINNSDNNVITDGTASSQWLCAALITDSSYSRCAELPPGEHQQLCDMFYVSGGPQFDGKKFGSEIVRHLMRSIAVDLGYTGVHGDMPINNLASTRISVTPEAGIITGVTPNSIYLADYRWTDVVLAYAALENVTPFSRILKEKRSPSKR